MCVFFGDFVGGRGYVYVVERRGGGLRERERALLTLTTPITPDLAILEA